MHPLVERITEVKIVDILGCVIYEGKLNGKASHEIPLNMHTQIIIVTAKSNQLSKSQKIFVSG
jgi:hypothetical protein